MTQRVLGIRSSADIVRFAVIEHNGTDFRLLNPVTVHNRLQFPAAARTPAEKLFWFDEELQRIIRAHAPISAIAIKSNELARGGLRAETLSARESAFLDAIALLVARRLTLKVDTYLYSNLGTSSKEVRALAEQEVERPEKNWDAQMADAVVAALKMCKS